MATTTLTRLCDELPDRLWLTGLRATKPAEARLVDAVASGNATTAALPAPIAIAAVAHLDHARIADAVVGDDRVTVQAAARTRLGTIDTTPTPVRTPGGKRPSVFDGTLDQVQARLAKRKTMRLEDALHGLATRPDADALVGDIVGLVNYRNYGPLMVKAAQGHLNVDCRTVAAALTCMNNWWPTWAMHALVEAGADSTAHVTLAEAVAASGLNVPCRGAVTAIGQAAARWPAAWQKLVVGSLVNEGAPLELVEPLLPVADTCTLIIAAQRRERDIAGAAMDRLEPFDLTSANCPDWAVANLVGQAGWAMDGSMLHAALARGLGSARTGEVIDRIGSANGPDAATVLAAIDQMNNNRLELLAAAMNLYLRKGITWRKTGGCDGPVALLRFHARQSGWAPLVDLVGVHRWVAVAAAQLCAETIDDTGLDETQAGTFLTMACNWTGTLDELAETVTYLDAQADQN
jgi:hypothetical protein